MECTKIIYDVKNAVATITLNNTEKLNACDLPGDNGMADQLLHCLEQADSDDQVKIVIIKGAGTSFCSGFDLIKPGKAYGLSANKSDARPSQRKRLQFSKKYHDFLAKFYYFPKILITQIHGYCVGLGTILVEASDLAYATPDAKLSHAEHLLGHCGSVGINLPLFLKVGLTKGRELLLTGRTLSGNEAKNCGLITDTFSEDTLEREIHKICQGLAKLPADGLYVGKIAYHATLDRLGMREGILQASIAHTLFTNMKMNEGEFNFIKERNNNGVKSAIQQRNELFSSLIQFEPS